MHIHEQSPKEKCQHKLNTRLMYCDLLSEV